MKPKQKNLAVMVARPSLNRMVLDALTAILESSDKEYCTAREVKDYIEQAFEIEYPIQTIIVVLNRFALKGNVSRVTYAGEEVRQRYGYYIPHSSQEMLEEKILQRFKAFADEFFHSNVEEALLGTHKLIVRHEAFTSRRDVTSTSKVKKKSKR